MQTIPRTVLSDLSDLTPGTTYHYPLVAPNRSGVRYGEDATFTMPT